MNMLLHGIAHADIRQEDTIRRPQHRDDNGELKRYDRVLANPPFSQNYIRKDIEYPGRFAVWLPEKGKKADLMFVQHMLAVLKGDGKMATVMPHGVLFRGGEERETRRHFIERGWLEAIIGLPAGLFYGTGIPACVLVLNKKDAPKRKHVVLINADRDYREGKAQNFLRAEDISRIVHAYRTLTTGERNEFPGYARRVPVEEIEGEDFNCNIRRYVDNAPPSEPHDVRAHLHGGVPKSEIDAFERYWINYPGLKARCFRERSMPSPNPLPQGEGSKSNDGIPSLPSPPGRGAGGEGPAGGDDPTTVKPTVPPELLRFARELRQSSTDAEGLMWRLLRCRQLANAKFRRQHPMPPYILDFYCHELKLAVELDGGQHNDPRHRGRDEERDAFMRAKGVRTLRFWNNEVLRETESVMEAVYQELIERRGSGFPDSPSPNPLPEGEGFPPPSPLGREAEAHGDPNLPSPPGRGARGEGTMDSAYLDFTPEVTDRRALADIVNCDKSVKAAHEAFLKTLKAWWDKHLPAIEALAPSNGPKGEKKPGNVYALRRSLLASIEQTFAGTKLLTGHQIRGAFARYVDELKADLKSIAASGWGPELIPDADILESQFPELLAEMQQKRTRLAELTALFAAANEEDYEDEDDVGVLPGDQVKALKDELKELNATWKTALKELKALATDLFTEMKVASVLSNGVKKSDVTRGMSAKDADFSAGQAILDLATKANFTSDRVDSVRERMQDGREALERAQAREARLERHKGLEDEAKQLKADLRATEKKQDELVEAAREKIDRIEARKVIIERLHRLLVQTYESYLRADQRACLAALENLHAKYATTATDIEHRRNAATAKLKGLLGELGYA